MTPRRGRATGHVRKDRGFELVNGDQRNLATGRMISLVLEEDLIGQQIPPPIFTTFTRRGLPMIYVVRALLVCAALVCSASAATSVSLSSSSYEVKEDLGFLDVSIIRSGDLSGQTSLDVATLD